MAGTKDMFDENIKIKEEKLGEEDLDIEDVANSVIKVKDEPRMIEIEMEVVKSEPLDDIPSTADAAVESPKPKKQKRKRGQNFSSEEKYRLVQLLLEHISVLLNKKTDSATNQAKQRSWMRIAEQFNAGLASNQRRGTQSLMKVWENLRAEARKYHSANRGSHSGAGGYCTTTKYNAILEQVVEIVGRSTAGIEGIQDSDWDGAISENNPEAEVTVNSQGEDSFVNSTVNGEIVQRQFEDEATPINSLTSKQVEDVTPKMRRPDIPGKNESTKGIIATVDCVQNLNKKKIVTEKLKESLVAEELEFKRKLWANQLLKSELEIETAQMDLEIKKELLNKLKAGGHIYEIRPFQCEYCRQQFKNITYLTKHVKEHGERAGKRYQCRICHQEFLLKINMNVHMVAHSLDGIHKCNRCDKIYTEQEMLERHSKEHIENGIFSCKVCGKQISDEVLLTEHTRTAHQPPPIPAIDACTPPLLAGVALAPTACDAPKDFTCNDCGKSFLYRCRLKRHVRVHLKCDAYACQHCGKVCLNYSTFAQHSAAHYTQPPYECGVCPLRFYARDKMEWHERKHGVEKPFACKYCGKRLASKCAYRLHLSTHEGRNKLMCTFCGTRFSQKASLYTHMKRKHGLRTPYACGICAETFEIKKDLEHHLKVVHNGLKVGQLALLVENSDVKTANGFDTATQSDPLTCDMGFKKIRLVKPADMHVDDGAKDVATSEQSISPKNVVSGDMRSDQITSENVESVID